MAKSFVKTMKITVVLAAAVTAGCGKAESFTVKEPQMNKEQQVLEAYAPIVQEEQGDTVQGWEDAGFDGITAEHSSEEAQAEAAEEKVSAEYSNVTEISLHKVSYGSNERYVLGESDYLILEPRTENGNSKRAVSQTAKKLNALKTANPDIPLYTYFINRATDMDWYRKDGIKVFSYADYFETQLGKNTQIKSGQFKAKDVRHYMETGYKTDFHVNNRGSYEVYQAIYGMLSSDLELSPMIIPERENHYENLLFNGLEGAAELEFSDEQMDAFRTYSFSLGEYDSYVDGKKTKIGLEKEYEQGKIVRDVDFTHQFSYYGGQSGVVEFDFHQPEKPNLLLLSDSQGRPSRKLLASHFNRTVFLDDIQYRSMDLQQLIEEKEIGVIIFMGQETMFEWYD